MEKKFAEMEKFRQLRLKFDQRRSMRSKAAKLQSQVEEMVTNNTNTTPNTAATPVEILNNNKAKAVSMPVKRPPVAEKDKPQVKMQKVPDTDSSSNDATEKKVKFASMPVKRTPANNQSKPPVQVAKMVDANKGVDENVIIEKKAKVVSMPVKRTPATEQGQLSVKTARVPETSKSGSNESLTTDKKNKVVGMPVKRNNNVAQEKPSVERSISADSGKMAVKKDNTVSMNVKRRETADSDKGKDSKLRHSAEFSGAAKSDVNDNKKEKKVKFEGMSAKTNKVSDKVTVPSVPVKSNETKPTPTRDSATNSANKTPPVPMKKPTLKEKENAQKDKSKTNVASSETNQTPKSVAVSNDKDVKANAKTSVNDKVSSTTDHSNNKNKELHFSDKKVKFVAPSVPKPDAKQEKKPETLKSALKKTNVSEQKANTNVDKLTVKDDSGKTSERKSSLSEDKLQELQETFAVFDQNRDGEITKEELGAVLYALGQRPTVTEVQALIRSVDLDKSGTIDFDEFEKIFSSKLTVDPEQELHEVFCIFDSNLDGFISDEELFTVLQKLGEHTSMTECKKMIQEADLNGDGKVDYREFKSILNSR